MPNDATVAAEKQSHQLAQQTRQRLVQFVFPLLVTLNQQLDVRLVRTFLASLEAIVQWRNRAHGLLLSELGAYLASPDQAPAGTKRLSNLLRSTNWAASLIEQFLWSKASAEIATLRASGEEPLAVWDESVLEKPESARSEGLCAVRSSKARRLKRIRPGFFNPPQGRPICVAGLHWLGLLITSRHTPPVVAAMEWWTTRGERASDHHSVLHALLARTQQSWGRTVRHVFDRGFANGPWLHTLLSYELRFVLRWKKGQKLLDGWGELRKAWEIARGKRTWSERMLRDTQTGKQHKVGIVVLPVNHPSHAQPLWLVVARVGKGREPWYLLTSDVLHTPDDAWAVVLAYGRRWQIETAWRYSKSELAMESPRLWSWERRVKLLLMVTLVYSFLLSLLEGGLEEVRKAVLRAGCHRTGKRSREVAAPLYRLRSALSRLWQDTRSVPRTHALNPG